MRTALQCGLAGVFLAGVAGLVQAATPVSGPKSAVTGGDEAPGADAQRQPGVPEGQIVGPLVWRGKSYPGVARQYWIYVPAQYRPTEPAGLMVFQDGLQYLRMDGHVRAALVFDNLIHRREMPVTIGVFVNPGYAAGEIRFTSHSLT